MPVLTALPIVTKAVLEIRPDFRFLFLFGFLLSGLFLYGMICISVSRYHSHVGAKHTNTLALSKAVLQLEKALAFIPYRAGFHLFDPDLARNHTLIGKTCLLQAKALEGEKTGRKYLNLLERSHKHFSLAFNLNPHDIKPAKGLAEATGLLEFEFSRQVFDKANPYNALPCFQELAKLRPNGLTVHYMIARYLDQKGLEEELFNAVAHIAFLRPGDVTNGDLKRERFYSTKLKDPIQKGLEAAIQQGSYSRPAYFALSRLMEEENNILNAIDQYKKGMEIQAYLNNTNTFIHLGTLYLQNNETGPALNAFETGLGLSPDFEHSFKRIFHTFKKHKAFAGFIEFAGKLETKIGPLDSIHLSIAKARMELGLNELARARLLRMLSNKSNPEGFYLLSVIAEQENDWDAMEINIQKALVLDPGKCHYYSKFAKALFKQDKTIQAQAQKAKERQCSTAEQN
jgi:hypothetical protein